RRDPRAGSGSPVAARPSRRGRTRPARRSLGEVELRPEHERAPAVDHPARLPARHGRSPGAGLRLDPDGVPVRDDDDESAGIGELPLRRRGPAGGDRRAGSTPRRRREPGDRHRRSRAHRGVEHLVALAERLGAAVVEGWHPAFVNFPRQHPLYGGIGGSAHLAGYLKDADLVFLAAAVAPWHPPSSAPGPSTKVVALSDDPLRSDVPFWGYRTDLVVTGDVEASLGMLVE